MKDCRYISLLASALVLMGCGTLAAQDAHVSVAWKIAPACGANLPNALLQQDMEAELRAASIAVSRVHTAGLVADFNCEAVSARSVPVQQCLSLSQAVPEPSAANGLHLATTWRNCQSYVCTRQNCGQLARTNQHTLFGQFVLAFRALSAESKTPDSSPAPEPRGAAGTSIQIAYAAVSKPTLNPGAIFYVFYILTCIAVFARWHWCR